MLITNQKWYDRLKFIAQVFLPALGSLYFGLSEIWGLPKGTEVVGTITLIDTFLGALLLISTHTYKRSNARFDGAMNLLETDTHEIFQIEVVDPEEIKHKDEVLLKVQRPPG